MGGSAFPVNNPRLEESDFTDREVRFFVFRDPFPDLGRDFSPMDSRSGKESFLLPESYEIQTYSFLLYLVRVGNMC